MIAPILRLLAIYLAVGLAVFGFFKRDALMGLFSGGDQPVAEAPAAEPEQSGPAGDPASTPEPDPVYAPLPAEGSATLSDDDLQAPVAANAPTPEPQTAPTASAAATPAVPAQVTPSVEPAPSNGTDQAYEQGLNAARRAYWQGDMQAAIAQYRKMLAQYPEDENLNGELGNIYYMTGDRGNAATYLEKAGMAALESGNPQQAQRLVGVLQSLEADAAARLTSVLGAAQ